MVANPRLPLQTNRSPPMERSRVPHYSESGLPKRPAGLGRNGV
jgi:hypothetical protein